MCPKKGTSNFCILCVLNCPGEARLPGSCERSMGHAIGCYEKQNHQNRFSCGNGFFCLFLTYNPSSLFCKISPLLLSTEIEMKSKAWHIIRMATFHLPNKLCWTTKHLFRNFLAVISQALHSFPQETIIFMRMALEDLSQENRVPDFKVRAPREKN